MSEEKHWAGLATVRLHGRDLVPAFVRVRGTVTDGELTAAAGSLVPGGDVRSMEGTSSVELLFPGDVLARATLGERQRGIMAWEGVLPWPDWNRIFEGRPSPRPRVVKGADYTELTAGAVLTPENWVPLEELGVAPGGRVLLDYRQVTAITAPLEPFLTAARQIDELGLKVAMVGSGLLVLGIQREASRFANAPRSEDVAVFEDYDEARFWLLG